MKTDKCIGVLLCHTPVLSATEDVFLCIFSVVFQKYRENPRRGSNSANAGLDEISIQI